MESTCSNMNSALIDDPANAELWYNRGLACRYTTRIGQSVRDFERAVELSGNTTGELARKFAEELKTSRQEVQQAIQSYGGHITLDKYIELEERFMRAMSLIRSSKWKEAEQEFRQLIEMGGR